MGLTPYGLFNMIFSVWSLMGPTPYIWSIKYDIVCMGGWRVGWVQATTPYGPFNIILYACGTSAGYKCVDNARLGCVREGVFPLSTICMRQHVHAAFPVSKQSQHLLIYWDIDDTGTLHDYSWIFTGTAGLVTTCKWRFNATLHTLHTFHTLHTLHTCKWHFIHFIPVNDNSYTSYL